MTKEFLKNYDGDLPIEVVIGDFGLSKVIEGENEDGFQMTNTFHIGSPFIWAPEMLD